MRQQMGWATLLLLVGCSGGDEGETAEAAPATATAAMSDTASPAAATDNTTPDIDCDEVQPHAAPKGQPADDVIGIRPGMTLQQSRDLLQCRKEAYAINVSNGMQSMPSGGQISQISLRADNGLDKLQVQLAGPAGDERVVQVIRTLEFAEGKAPPVESIKSELATKYGEFDMSGYPNRGDIVRSRDGQRLSKENSSYSQCRASHLRISEAMPCLTAISFELSPQASNPALARQFTLSVTNHALLGQMADATQRANAVEVEKAKARTEEQGLQL